jgi:hypothetical protein
VQHVTAILDYVDARTANPTGQVLQSARDLMASLDAWSFLGSTSNYDIQIRALDVLQCLAYNDVDRGAIADIGNWALERWLRVLQRHPRSVSALKGKPARVSCSPSRVAEFRRSRQLVALESPTMSRSYPCCGGELIRQ